MAKDIKFGTDGWPGVIADDYTFENVRRAGGAIAAYVLKNEDAKKGIVRPRKPVQDGLGVGGAPVTAGGGLFSGRGAPATPGADTQER